MLTRGRATIVMGVQFGDEGKGKIIDVLSEHADLVCRVQGGNNAGHTIWIGKQKVVTHLLPSGILRPDKIVAIGPGVVLDPVVLQSEIAGLSSQGVSITPDRLWIDPRAHVIMPLHKQQERLGEDRLSRLAASASLPDAASDAPSAGAPIGTTGRGIGPAYASKALRDGPRVCDVVSASRLESFFARHPDYKASFSNQGSPGTDLPTWLAAAGKIAPFVTDVAARSQDALARGARVLIEGAQGAMLDVGFGTYPFVTSSSLVSGAACAGLGVPPTAVDRVIGVTKAYATRVGNGPFPGELSGTLETELRERGHEYGATTGRPRRVGWLDLVALRYFARLNGLTELVLMKSDVLAGCDQVGLVTEYVRRLDRRTIGALDWPTHIEEWEDIEPVLSFVPGWTEVLSVDNTISSRALRGFVATLEQRAGVPVRYVSTGPERSQGIWL